MRFLPGLVSIFAVTACGPAHLDLSDGSQPREQILSRLETAPRKIAISIEGVQSGPVIRVFEYHDDEPIGAAEGALKALKEYGSAMGTVSTDGQVLMLVFLPAVVIGGAIYGATWVETTTSSHEYPLAEMQGAQALRRAAAQDANLSALLRANLSKRAATLDRHSVRVVSPGWLADAKIDEFPDVQTTVTIEFYALVGDLEDDPHLKYLAAGKVVVEAEWAERAYGCKWAYQGPQRLLSEWSADGAKHFIDETKQAVDEVAAKILASLKRGPENCSESYSVLPVRAGEARRKMLTDAESGDLKAAFALYRSGDLNAARFLWLCRAAHGGYALAQEELGDLYTSERGLEARNLGFAELNLVQGYKWYSLAQVNGLPRAKFLRDQLEQKMTSDQIREARQLAADWKPDPARCRAGAS